MDTTAISILKETIKRIDGAYAPATIRAYESNFERFIIFCDNRNSIAIPANDADITSYIQHLIKENLKSASIRIAIASISAIHRLNQYTDPTRHSNVKLEIRRMHRRLGRESKQAIGINVSHLKEMLKTTDNSLKGLRDKALLLTAYDCMCRRSEIVSLSLDDAIIDQENESIKIKLRRSKTDQDGLGRWLYLTKEAQLAIIKWIEASKIDSGKLFRGITKVNKTSKSLSCAQINRIFKSAAIKARLDQPLIRNISGHSMRVGAAQDLLISGASLPMIMQRGRWSKADTVMRYIENTSF
jgi:site-specific recombinase XerD